MPLIRYRLGDLMEVDGAPCRCGRAFPTFRRVLGRQDDVIVTPDGRQIGRLDPAFKGVDGLLESQVEQVAPDRVIVRLVPASGFTPEAAEIIRRQVAERMGPSVIVSTELHASLPRGRGGKLRAVLALRRNQTPDNVQRSAGS
jgi:phenylacetate-CoA ligase